MSLSEEEKKKIYEEEKARIEAREQIEKERQGGENTSTGLEPNVAGLLCYLGGWISGLIFFILEQKNNWVRFHAAQSIVVFGTLTVAGIILGWIPVVGDVFSWIIAIAGFIFWIILMVNSYRGDRYKIPWAGDVAEKMLASSVGRVESSEAARARAATESPAQPEPAKLRDYVEGRREARIAASAVAIAWSIVLLVFFHFFNQYVAYYHSETAGHVTTWTRYPFFTEEISLWLPILTATLIISIVGHFVLIIFDRYILREVIQIVLDVLGLATVLTLLSIFPFDFSVIPDTTSADITHIVVTVVLAGISVGFGIGILVRVIKLIVNLVKGVTSYEAKT